jgi:hypothetical protein
LRKQLELLEKGAFGSGRSSDFHGMLIGIDRIGQRLNMVMVEREREWLNMLKPQR